MHGPFQTIHVADTVQVKLSCRNMNHRNHMNHMNEPRAQELLQRRFVDRTQTKTTQITQTSPTTQKTQVTLRKKDRQNEITKLFRRFNTRDGAGIATARAMLDELKKQNHKWGIRDLEDVQKGIEAGVAQLSYWDYMTWIPHLKALKKFQTEEVLVYLDSFKEKS